jgi:hypothetical protein
MVIWILNFGDGLLALNYLIFAAVASLGTLQFVASRARLIGLMLFSPQVSKWVGIALVGGAYVWFFASQPDLFIPGLAGGEFFTLFIVGFGLGLLAAIALGILANRVLARVSLRLPNLREPVKLAGGATAELWLPKNPTPPIVIALREAVTDSLDFLGSDLVEMGAAVLLCSEASAEAAIEFVEQTAERFHPTRRFAMGVGHGADRVLELVNKNDKINAVLALAPFGNEENTRPGLRWLRETDYLTALFMTRRPGRVPEVKISPPAYVVYGDEDTLIPSTPALRIHPSALCVGGARHFTLARMAATRRLACDLFDLQPAAVPAFGGVTATSAPMGGVSASEP